MLRNYSPVVQALIGTLFTWALTAAGAALVVVIRGKQVSVVLSEFIVCMFACFFDRSSIIRLMFHTIVICNI